MELELSEDQQLLLDTTRRFLAAECPMPTVRGLEHVAEGFERDWWKRAAGLGWTSLLVPESLGGGSLSAHGVLDLVLVAEEMGRTVAPGPLVPVNVVAAALAARGTSELQRAWLPGLLAGEVVAAWCGPTAVPASLDGDSIVITGVIAPVEAGTGAEVLLVTVDCGNGPTEVVVPAATDGVTVVAMGGLDLVRRYAQVRFDGARLPAAAVLGEVGGAADGVERSLQLACALQCAETVGALDRVFEMTLEYLGDRYSFGRPLSSYQVLKHRLADSKVWLEACHGIATGAARAIAEDADEAGDLVSAAKAWIGPHATEMIQDCVQLHGGIGVTWEHDLHLYLRRATVNRATYGTPEDHSERLATKLLGAAS